MLQYYKFKHSCFNIIDLYTSCYNIIDLNGSCYNIIYLSTSCYNIIYLSGSCLNYYRFRKKKNNVRLKALVSIYNTLYPTMKISIISHLTLCYCRLHQLYRKLVLEEEFEDTKGVIGIRISKNRQHNGLKKKYKTTNNDQQNIHIKLKF